MLNSGKIICAPLDKKKCNSRVVRKQIMNEKKNINSPALQVKWSVPKKGTFNKSNGRQDLPYIL